MSFCHNSHTHTQFPDAGGASYQTLQSNLSSAAAALNVTGSEVVSAARATPEQQAVATAKFSSCYEELLKAGLTLAGASKVWRKKAHYCLVA